MKRIILAALCAVILFASGCGRETRNQYVTIDGFAQGSTYHFVLGTSDTTGLQRAIDSLFLAVDMSMSVYQEGSLVNRLNSNETDSVDRYIQYCIEVCEEISRMSGGRFDITIKPVTQAWGFAGEGKAADPDIDSLLQFVGYEKIRIENGRLVKSDPRVQIDLNTVAQGYTADLLGELMESRGIDDYLVEIGGEIFCRGQSARGGDWTVGIDKPYEGNFIPGKDLQVKISMSGQGLATSGNYRKYYTDAQGRKITHIVDATTGYTTQSNLLSTTVVADNATLADVYGTLLMIIGLEESIEFLERSDIAGYLVYSDDEGNFCEYASPAMKDKIVE